jgi:hypothetical protein
VEGIGFDQRAVQIHTQWDMGSGGDGWGCGQDFLVSFQRISRVRGELPGPLDIRTSIALPANR